jgi:hypothetical protein
MEDSPRYCFCSAGQPPWPARPADRYCGLCGRELLAVRPRAPLLAAGPPATVVAYLRPEARAWVGALRLDLCGLTAGKPEVHCAPLTRPAPRFVGLGPSTPTSLELPLWAGFADRPAPGPLGCARLSVTLHGQTFTFQVAAFGVAPAPRAWCCVRPGQFGAGRVLVLRHGAHHARTFLELHAGAGVPVQWESIRCDHPAVTVVPLHPGRARAPAIAQAFWDAALVGEEDEEAVLRLRACGLPEVVLRQQVRRVTPRPVRFRPAALVVNRLAEDGPQTRLVRLTNRDSRAVVIRAVERSPGWVAGVRLPARLPMRLAPGVTRTIRVDLHLHELNGLTPPYLGRVDLVLEGRGRQSYPVRVEEIRAARRAPGPLLLDPGPPRVVLARWDEARGRLAYLPCSGDGGIEPEDLGLGRREYAAAACGGRPAHRVLEYLLAAARTRCLMRDQLDFAEVRICRHPWVPPDFDAPEVELCDWAALALTRLARHVPAPALVRLDLGDACLVEVPGRGRVPLLSPDEQAHSLGAVLVRWLAGQFADGLRRRRERVPAGLLAAAEGRPTGEEGWMRLACAALLADCRWGLPYAWRRLLRGWRAALPEVGDVALDLPAAHRQLVRAVADHAQQACGAVVRARAGEGPGGLLLLGDLSGSPPFRGVLRSIFTSAGFQAECAEAPWVSWLALPRPGAGTEVPRCPDAPASPRPSSLSPPSP